MRGLPPHRNFILAAGLPQVVDYLLNLSFAAEEIDYLRGLDPFRLVSPAFFDYLRGFRFTGDLFAIPEGTPVFPGETGGSPSARPSSRRRSRKPTYSRRWRSSRWSRPRRRGSVEVAGGRAVVEFGTRRAHTPEAGVGRRARAAYIGGCAGTSNTLAGFRYGIPVMGTSAHSWVMSFPGEMEAFRQLQRVLGDFHGPAHRYFTDTLEGARRAAGLGGPCGACASIAATSRPSRARSAPFSTRPACPKPGSW